MGTQRTTTSSFFRIPGDNYKIPKFIDHLVPGSSLALPDILSRNITTEECQKQKLQHKRIPHDVEFFDENDTPVSYEIHHEDNPNGTCNDFYLTKYKRGDEKKLRLQNDGEEFTISSVFKEIPIISIQQTSDCFGLGKSINQFRRIYGLETQSNVCVDTSNTEFSSINSLSSSEEDTADSASLYKNSHHISTDS